MLLPFTFLASLVSYYGIVCCFLVSCYIAYSNFESCFCCLYSSMFNFAVYIFLKYDLRIRELRCLDYFIDILLPVLCLAMFETFRNLNCKKVNEI